MRLSTIAAIALIVLSLVIIVRLVSFPLGHELASAPSIHYTKSPPGPPTPDLPPTPDVPEPAMPSPPSKYLGSSSNIILPILFFMVIGTTFQLIKEANR